MIRHGDAPYLECSSQGDQRFSAFYARIQARDNRTIEEIYQSSKIFDDGRTGLNWREAKGRQAINQQDCAALYSTLWDEYLKEQPSLLPVLTAASGLSDKFGQPGRCCQATELWRIRGQERARAAQAPLPLPLPPPPPRKYAPAAQSTLPAPGRDPNTPSGLTPLEAFSRLETLIRNAQERGHEQFPPSPYLDADHEYQDSLIQTVRDRLSKQPSITPASSREIERD